jgi:hypothetical protein
MKCFLVDCNAPGITFICDYDDLRAAKESMRMLGCMPASVSAPPRGDRVVDFPAFRIGEGRAALCRGCEGRGFIGSFEICGGARPCPACTKSF